MYNDQLITLDFFPFIQVLEKIADYFFCSGKINLNEQ